MKKFLIFLVSIIVVVSLGLTTFYFLRNDEVIDVKTKELYVNAGDTISLDALNIEVKKSTKKTSFNYNAGGEEVTNLIKYNTKTGYYTVSNDAQGDVVLVISTTNSKYSKFLVNVHIGNGSVSNPYYIFNETSLSKIGVDYNLNSNFILMNDITLTHGFKPIGYNSSTGVWAGFGGTFNGQGYKISGLNVATDMQNAGLFTTINANGVVSDLIIDKATITGEFDNVGVFAGVVDGNVKKVQITNSTIVNNKDNSNTGAFAGTVLGNVKMSYASQVNVKVGSAQTLNSINLGGFAGVVDNATLQATYANDVTLLVNGNGNIGGLVGLFVIGDQVGTIQQSYANVACDNSTFGAFVGSIDSSNATDSMISHLVGNVAITGKAVSSVASEFDTSLVNNFDNTYFHNDNGNPVFFDETTSLYMIKASKDISSVNEYVFYAVDSLHIVYWDTNYVWKTQLGTLPKLRMGAVEPTSPTGEYLRRDLAVKNIATKENFLVDYFSTDTNNSKYQFIADVDISNENYVPVNLTNVTIDGNNHVLTVNLNQANNNNLGVFAVLDNCTIKNLTIKVVGVNTNADYFGALAAKITSTTAGVNSSVENVNIVFDCDDIKTTHKYFGGLAGEISNAILTNNTVKDLAISQEANIENAAGLVANVVSGVVNSNNVQATVSSSTKLAGVVAENSGSVINSTGKVVVNYQKAVANATVGGIVATNNGLVEDGNVDVTINVSVANAGLYVGGVAGVNNSEIKNTTVTGSGISLSNSILNRVNVGGVAGLNDGTIVGGYNRLNQLGSYYLNKNFYVGGVVAVNSGSISKAIVSSNISGNYVAGVVVEMISGSSSNINQVYVGKYAKSGNEFTFTANHITGDKLVAGVVVDFRAGKISDVQAVSEIEGTTNDCRVSLVALIFPNNVELTNSTINSSLQGNGHFYKETWKDFEQFTDKASLNLAESEYAGDRFNIYGVSSAAGNMVSVVINTSNSGVQDAMGAWAVGRNVLFVSAGTDYDDNGVSCVRYASENEFNSASTFSGNFTFVVGSSSGIGGGEKTATKPLTFEIGTSENSVWSANNGIMLTFLANVD